MITVNLGAPFPAAGDTPGATVNFGERGRWRPRSWFKRNTTKLPDLRIPASKNDNLGKLAHARPALSICAPAFFRHVMIFFPYAGEVHDPYPGKFIGHRHDFLRRIKPFILNIEAHEHRADTEKRLDDDRDLTRTFISRGFPFEGFDVRVAIDLYSEFATITWVLDNNKGLQNADDIESLRGLSRVWHSKLRACGVKAIADNYQDDQPRISQLLYFGIWDLLKIAQPFHGLFPVEGRLVGDFRGFAVSPIGCDDKTRADTAQCGTSADPGLTIPDNARPRQDVLSYLQRHLPSFFLDCLALNSSGENLETAAKRVREEPNVVLCRMLNGDAVYGSALGNDAQTHGLDPVPITYFFIYNGQSSDQLGRMVRRQNLLGELRLAALFDADTIRALGRPIRDLGAIMTDLLSYGMESSSVGRDQLVSAIRLYRAIGEKCHGGLAYRFARANYYYDELQARMKDTRSKPIRGWQSYPGFISRHFDQRFRSMRSTGQRYVDMRSSIDRIATIYSNERQRLLVRSNRLVAIGLFILSASSLVSTLLVSNRLLKPEWLYVILLALLVLSAYLAWSLLATPKAANDPSAEPASRLTRWLIRATALLIALILLYTAFAVG